MSHGSRGPAAWLGFIALALAFGTLLACGAFAVLCPPREGTHDDELSALDGLFAKKRLKLTGRCEPDGECKVPTRG